MESSTLAASIAVHQSQGSSANLGRITLSTSICSSTVGHAGAVPFSTSSLHHSLQMSASLSIVLPLWPSYAPRSAARLMGVVCHHHRLEKGSSWTERRCLCDENHRSSNTRVVLRGYHTRHLFRFAFVSTKRTVDNRTRRTSSSSLWLLSLAKYHKISSFGNMW